MSLLDKSNQNFEIAEDAAKKNYFDVAVSRLYYSNYQRMCLFFTNKKNKKEKANANNTFISVIIGIRQHGSHEKELIKFSEYIENKEISLLTMFINNKAERQKSDYEEGFVGETCYIDVKNNAKFINNYIDKNNK